MPSIRLSLNWRRRVAHVAVVALIAIAIYFQEDILILAGRIVLWTDRVTGNETSTSGTPMDRLMAELDVEPDPAIRAEWHDAIRRYQRILEAKQDSEMIASSIRDNATSVTTQLRSYMLACLAKDTEENRQFARQLTTRLGSSDSQRNRQFALVCFVELFPNDDELDRLLAEFIRSGGDVRWMAQLVRSIAVKRPDIYRQLLQTGHKEKLLALTALRDRNPSEKDEVSGDSVVSDLAAQEAIKFLASDAPIDRDTSIAFLTSSPERVRRLIQSMGAISDQSFRLRTVLALIDMLQTHAFPLNSEDCEQLLQLLVDPDPRVRAAASGISHFAQHENVQVFRDLLDRYPGENDEVALDFFHRFGMADEDIMRIVEAIRRGLTKRLTPRIAVAFNDMRAQHPEHPAICDLIANHPELETYDSGIHRPVHTRR